MKHLAPACFRAFACAAGSCPDSCCRAGWEIVPDEATLNLYETLPGPAGERVRAGVAPPVAPAICRPAACRPKDDAAAAGDPLLRQNASRVCVLLDEDGLCCVQKRFGHEALCKVCRDYPRFRRDFGGLTEHGLSLSCPTAYALATAAPPVWEEWEDDTPPIPNELDPAAYLRLRKGRTLALDLLANENIPFGHRLALVRRLAAVMQAAPERRIRHNYEPRLRRWTTCSGKTNSQFSTLNSQFPALARRFLSLEILSPIWRDALERFSALMEAERTAECRPCTAARISKHRPSKDVLPTPPDPEPYARWLWYELYKYWMDALDDGQLLARVDRALDMLLLGLAMDQALPGEGPFLRRISREIEHCEENLAALLIEKTPLR